MRTKISANRRGLQNNILEQLIKKVVSTNFGTPAVPISYISITFQRVAILLENLQNYGPELLRIPKCCFVTPYLVALPAYRTWYRGSVGASPHGKREAYQLFVLVCRVAHVEI